MNKLKQFKNQFDKITSNESKNWQLVLFWIFIFEIFASIFEYYFVGNSNAFVVKMHNNIAYELFVGVYLTLFLWTCVFNFIFWNIVNLLWLCLLTVTGIYFLITNDITFNLLLHNLFPVHYFQASFSYAILIELLFKGIIIYLIYQLILSLKNKNSTASKN